MDIHRGEVWLARFSAFPQEPLEASKDRPVVVVQNDEDSGNLYYPFVVVLPISSQKVERLYKQDVFLPGGTAGLTENSKVLVGVVRTIQKSDLLRKLGQLPENKMEEINIKLLRQFGFLER